MAEDADAGAPTKQARPLAPAALEMRLVGRSHIYLGVPFWLIGVLAEPWPRALIIAPVLGVLAAVGLHRFYRRAARAGIQADRLPATDDRELPLATRGRAALMVANRTASWTRATST
jgi:hypothetical protein